MWSSSKRRYSPNLYENIRINLSILNINTSSKFVKPNKYLFFNSITYNYKRFYSTNYNGNTGINPTPIFV